MQDNKLYDEILSKLNAIRERSGKITLYFFLLILGINFYTIYQLTDILKQGETIKENAINNSATLSAIFTKISADERERVNFIKLQKNLEVWRETGCIQCHNTQELALPISKISIPEAIKIVRNGNERTRAGGMPSYLPRNTRGADSITDSELQVRMQQLYIKEFLFYAK